MNDFRQRVVLIVFAALAAPAWAQDENAEDVPDIDASEVEEIEIDPDALPPSEPGCFNVRNVRNFSPIDDNHIAVEERRDQWFLLTMDRGCFGLRNAQGIAIDNVMNRVCSNSQARVTFRGVGRAVESCRVREVESVEDLEAARTIVSIRRQNSR